MNIRTAVIAALAALALATTAACSAASGSTADDAASTGSNQPATAKSTTNSGLRVINATGTGTASGTPDTVAVSLGVTTRAAEASAALAENNKAANTVIKKLRNFGLGEKDLQTSGLYIYPTYSDNGMDINGYEVSNSVVATLHDVDKAGALIDTAQQAAGNAIRVDGINFSFADDSDLRAQARAAAVEQAMTQAKQLADAAGLEIGEIQSISESAGGYDMPMYAQASADSAGSSPILPGSADLSVTVQVTVAIG